MNFFLFSIDFFSNISSSLEHAQNSESLQVTGHVLLHVLQVLIWFDNFL